MRTYRRKVETWENVPLTDESIAEYLQDTLLVDPFNWAGFPMILNMRQGRFY